MKISDNYVFHNLNSFQEFSGEIIKILQGYYNLFNQPVIVSEQKGFAEYLKKEIALTQEIYAGIAFSDPETFIKNSLSFFLETKDLKTIPGSGELELLIYNYFLKITSNNLKTDKSLSLFLNNLEKEDQILNRIRFASLIAKNLVLFSKAAPVMCRQWEKNQLTGTHENEGWLKDIFNHLFTNYTEISPFYDPLEKILQTQPAPLSPLPPVIIIAGYLPQYELIRKFYIYLSEFVPVYHLSVYPDIKRTIIKENHAVNEYKYFSAKAKIKDQKQNYPDQNNTLSAVRDLLLYDKEIKKDLIPDKSFKIISCPGIMRQAEAARDILLDIFNENHIKPHEAAILAPDIQEFKPALEASFAREITSSFKNGIPLNLFDLTVSEISPVIQAFLKLINLSSSSFSFKELDEIFHNPCFAKAMSLDQECIKLFRDTAKEFNFIRNIDEEQAIINGEKEFRFNTLESSWLRIFINYSFGEGYRFNNLKTDEFSASETNLGKVMRTIYELQTNYTAESLKARPLFKWCEKSLQWIEQFIALRNNIRDDIRDKGILCQIIADLEEEDILKEDLDFSVFIHLLTERLERAVVRQGNGVTAGSLRSFSTTPFKVIIVLGLDYKKFPLKESDNSVNMLRTSNHTLPKDWLTSSDMDKRHFYNLFLNNPLSLNLLYDGEDIHTGEEKPASLLLDNLKEKLGKHIHKNNFTKLFIKYPLKDYSLKFFKKNSDLFTYNKSSYQAFRALANPLPRNRENLKTIKDSPLPEFSSIDLRDLLNFLKNPALSYFRHRLGLYYYNTIPFTYPAVNISPLDFFSTHDLLRDILLENDSNNTDNERINIFIKDLYYKGNISSEAQAAYLVKDLAAKINHLKIQTADLSFPEKKSFSLTDNLFISKESNYLKLSPLNLKIKDEEIVRITGLIDHASSLLLTISRKRTEVKDLLNVWLVSLILKSHPELKEEYKELNIAAASLENKKYKLIPIDISSETALDILREIIIAFKDNLASPLPMFPDICFKTLAIAEKEENDPFTIETLLTKNLQNICSRKEHAALLFKDQMINSDECLKIRNYSALIYSSLYKSFKSR